MAQSLTQRERHRYWRSNLPFWKRVQYEIIQVPVRVRFTYRYGPRYLYDERFRYRMARSRAKAKRRHSSNNKKLHRMRVAQRDGNWCRGCNEPAWKVHLTLDHRIPLRDGGKDEFSNWQLLCEPCHQKKDRLPHTKNGFFAALWSAIKGGPTRL